MKSLFSKSWKTTAAGVVAFLALVFGEVQKELDDDPETNANWNVIVEAGALLWMGLSGRDNNVSSEQVGAGNTGPNK